MEEGRLLPKDMPPAGTKWRACSCASVLLNQLALSDALFVFLEPLVSIIFYGLHLLDVSEVCTSKANTIRHGTFKLLKMKMKKLCFVLCGTGPAAGRGRAAGLRAGAEFENHRACPPFYSSI